MTLAKVDFLDDATWNDEREAVEVTAIVASEGAQRRVTCVISKEALDSLVRTPSALPLLRVFRDFESGLAKVAARRQDNRADEVVITRRDVSAVGLG